MSFLRLRLGGCFFAGRAYRQFMEYYDSREVEVNVRVKCGRDSVKQARLR